MRKRKPYLINPVGNPYEVYRVPTRRVVAKTDKRGRFVKVASLSRKKKHGSKKISRRTAVKLFRKAARISHKKRYTKRVHKNPIMLYNPIKRRHSMRKRYHRNPMMDIFKRQESQEILNLAVDGAIIVGGTMVGKLAIDKLAEKFPIINKPYGKVASHILLGSAVYFLGKKIGKLSPRVVRLASLGIMMPAVIEAIDMVKSKVSGIKELPNTEGYVPDVEAYIPSDVGDYSPEY